MLPMVLLLLATHSIAYAQWELLLLYQPDTHEECDSYIGNSDYLPSARERCDFNPAQFGGPQKCREIIDTCAKIYNAPMRSHSQM